MFDVGALSALVYVTLTSSACDFWASAGAGVVVAYTTFPLEGLKKHLTNIPRTVAKFHPFKGSTIFAANIIPTTILQLFTDKLMQQYKTEGAGRILNCLSGFAGALTGTVVENCVVRQQVLQCGPRVALKDMLRQGPLRPWKSYPLVALRDSIFTMCMFDLNPRMLRYIDEQTSGSTGVKVAGSLALCTLGAALSHPFDTIATRMQRTHARMGFLEASRDVMENLGGYRGFYKGFHCRIGLFFAFTNAIPYVRDTIANRLK